MYYTFSITNVKGAPQIRRLKRQEVVNKAIAKKKESTKDKMVRNGEKRFNDHWIGISLEEKGMGQEEVFDRVLDLKGCSAMITIFNLYLTRNIGIEDFLDFETVL